jgi:tetratricopeptide (TPR) repeat protein
LIHSNDYPAVADKGLTAAMCYADIAPVAPHALHMPSHIFTRVGLWQQSAATNQRSIVAARAANGITDQLHAYDYMVYADLQMGRDQEARRIVDQVNLLVEQNRAADYARSAIPARYAVERGMWQEAARLSDPDPSKFPFTSAIRIFARALGAARSGDPDAADRDAGRLRDIGATLKATKDEYWSAEVEVQQLGAEAWVAYAKGDHEQAIVLMRAAADKEDLSEKSSVSPGRLVPARELLGDMLLDSGRPADALAEYQASQTRDPRRFRGVWGAAQAAARAGDGSKARIYYVQLVEIAGDGDPRPELAVARDYIASN